MKVRNILFGLLVLFSPMVASAQLYAIRDSVANGYNFWLYLPKEYKDLRTERENIQAKDSIQAPLPIVVFLHGRSLSGTDLYMVRKYGTLDALSAGRKIEAVVVAPQVKLGDWWRPNRVMNVVKWVQKRYDVDSTRLYVLGMSLGGFGAIDFAATYPDKTAAAMAFCGGSTRKTADLGRLNKVPLWIMHGTADRDVPISDSRRVVEAMREANEQTPMLRYDEFEGSGHSIFARTFYLNESYEWLFKHSTADSVRVVDRTIEIPLARLNKPYTGLKFGSVKLKVVDPKGVPSNPTPWKGPAQYHEIQSGDTLGHLAIKYKTSVKAICALNNITEKTILKVGKKLRVK